MIDLNRIERMLHLALILSIANAGIANRGTNSSSTWRTINIYQ
jgi:hypothetical protein